MSSPCYGPGHKGYICYHCNPHSDPYQTPQEYADHVETDHPGTWAVPVKGEPGDSDHTSFCQSVAKYFPRFLPPEMGLFQWGVERVPGRPRLLLDPQGQFVRGPAPRHEILYNFPNMPTQIHSQEEDWRLVLFQVMSPGSTRQDLIDRMYWIGSQPFKQVVTFKKDLRQKMELYRAGEGRGREGKRKSWRMMPTLVSSGWVCRISRHKIFALDALTEQQIQKQVVWDIVDSGSSFAMPRPIDLGERELWKPASHALPPANIAVSSHESVKTSLRQLEASRVLAIHLETPLRDFKQPQMDLLRKLLELLVENGTLRGTEEQVSNLINANLPMGNIPSGTAMQAYSVQSLPTVPAHGPNSRLGNIAPGCGQANAAPPMQGSSNPTHGMPATGRAQGGPAAPFGNPMQGYPFQQQIHAGPGQTNAAPPMQDSSNQTGWMGYQPEAWPEEEDLEELNRVMARIPSPETQMMEFYREFLQSLSD